MQINELTLKRFKNHVDKTVVFKPGVNGIVGSNGSGKSSIIQAINFLFTGEADSTKEDLITRGGVGSSYVKCNFTLNDKQGMIERHVDSSRVLLEYDGVKYIKSTEVKELWARLLQIDAHIFRHVIIAHQKKIPELFSGDNSVREKAFQKIFLVPNTEKIRTTLWNNYINVCPPALPEEPTDDLQCKILELTNKVNPMEYKISLLATSVLTDVQVTSVFHTVERLKRCIKDGEEKPALHRQQQNIENSIGITIPEEVRLKEWLSGVDIVSIKAKHEELIKLQAINELRLKKYNQLMIVKSECPFTVDEVSKAKVLSKELSEVHQSINTKLASVGALLEHHRKEHENFSTLDGHGICPTCKQGLADVWDIVNNNKLIVEALKAEHGELLISQGENYEELAQNREIIFRYNDYKIRLDNAEREYESYGGCAFSTAEFDDVKKLMVEYDSHFSSYLKAEKNLAKLRSDLAMVELKLNNLVTYEGTSSAVEELSIMLEVMQVNKQRNEDLAVTKMELVRHKSELSMVQSRLDTSLRNHQRNSNRELYLENLKKIYDVLHTSQFPRKLIQTYSSTVEEELTLNLHRFAAFPYRPQIGEGFKINLIDEHEQVIPYPSGGQEMIVGLCLRLALHSMFSQSFPILILDEGTTHLDIANAKSYFECIKELKNHKAIKQLIVIDHNPDLAEVVDHVIQL